MASPDSSQSLSDRLKRLALVFMWSASARQDFYTLIADFVMDNVPITDAVGKVHARWQAFGDSRALITGALLSEMLGKSGEAVRLGQALANWVPSMEAIAIDAGERAGNIGDGLRMAARLSGVKAAIRTAVLGALAYPFVLIMMLFGVLVTMRSEIMPIMLDMLPREKWPAMPAMLGRIAENVELIIGGTTAGIVVVMASYAMSVGPWVGLVRDRFDNYIFPWSLNRNISGAVIMACFSAMLNARIPLSETLARMAATASPWERMHLEEIRNRMRSGKNDGEAIATLLFDEPVRWKLGIYGPLTAFAAALNNLSERQIEALLKKIRFTMSIIAFVCMGGVAGMVILLYGSFMQISQAAKDAAQGFM